MPIYEYHCKNCKKDFELIQKASDPPLALCPTCKKKVKRVISQTSFMLKGSGWYKDGYSAAKSAPKKETPGETSKGETSKSETPKNEAPKKPVTRDS